MKSVGYLQALARPLPTYTGPPWRAPEPEVPIADAEVAAWRMKWGATCSDRVARLLCTLARDYAQPDR